MDYSIFLYPALTGFLVGLWIGLLGYMKNSAASADPVSSFWQKITSKDFNHGSFFLTLFGCGCGGVLVSTLIYLGIPTEVFLSLVPLALRESLTDIASLTKYVIKKGDSSGKESNSKIG